MLPYLVYIYSINSDPPTPSIVTSLDAKFQNVMRSPSYSFQEVDSPVVVCYSVPTLFKQNMSYFWPAQLPWLHRPIYLQTWNIHSYKRPSIKPSVEFPDAIYYQSREQRFMVMVRHYACTCQLNLEGLQVTHRFLTEVCLTIQAKVTLTTAILWHNSDIKNGRKQIFWDILTAKVHDRGGFWGIFYTNSMG